MALFLRSSFDIPDIRFISRDSFSLTRHRDSTEHSELEKENVIESVNESGDSFRIVESVTVDPVCGYVLDSFFFFYNVRFKRTFLGTIFVTCSRSPSRG